MVGEELVDGGGAVGVGGQGVEADGFQARVPEEFRAGDQVHALRMSWVAKVCRNTCGPNGWVSVTPAESPVAVMIERAARSVIRVPRADSSDADKGDPMCCGRSASQACR